MSSTPVRSVGLDLGGTKCLGVLTDDAGTVVDEHRVATPTGSDAIVDALASVGGELIRRAGGPTSVAGVGAGVPGLVDGRGILRFAPNLPGVVDLDVASALRSRLELPASVPVVIENDASCAAWGERCVGAGAGASHAILVTLGTGIGGGLVLDGRLYRGANGFAGEIGHMIVDPRGPRCPCGQRGCWERFASGSGLGALAREAAVAGRARALVTAAGGSVDDVRGEHVTKLAASGDEGAMAIMREFGWWVALGLSNLANAFDPAIFVLGGGLVEAGDVLLDPVRDAFASLLEGADHRPPITIVPAALGEHAGAIGAALLAIA